MNGYFSTFEVFLIIYVDLNLLMKIWYISYDKVGDRLYGQIFYVELKS